MKLKLCWLAALLVIIIYGCKQQPANLYKVVKVKDGDTMELLSSDYKNITVRLAGVDCPEKNQAYGQKAKQFTADLCFGKLVSLEADNTDRYGRTVGTLKLEDGTNVNYELVKNGYAWQYVQYSTDPELAALQQSAREQRLGLWQDARPTPPWKFRKHKPKQAKKRKHKQQEIVF